MVIFEKTGRGGSPNVISFPLSKENTNSTKESVSEPIYKFLFDRTLNRLGSPHKHVKITNKDLLVEWQKKNDEKKRKKISENCIGDYDIFYRRDAKIDKLTKDHLSIEIDPITGAVIAKYIHKIPSGESLSWVGKLSQSVAARALFIDLKATFSEKANLDTNKIFLILNLTPGVSFNILTGSISGIRDEANGCLSILVVARKFLVKDSLIDDEQELKEKDESISVVITHNNVVDKDAEVDVITKFLKAYENRSTVIPPVISVVSIDSLQSCIGGEGDKADKF